jgi:hypothetical protein
MEFLLATNPDPLHHEDHRTGHLRVSREHPSLFWTEIAFADTHTFLLVNGLDLHVDPAEACEFMMNSIAHGEFRFTQILAWLEIAQRT